jgi:hypothetical protein
MGGWGARGKRGRAYEDKLDAWAVFEDLIEPLGCGVRRG